MQKRKVTVNGLHTMLNGSKTQKMDTAQYHYILRGYNATIPTHTVSNFLLQKFLNVANPNSTFCVQKL